MHYSGIQQAATAPEAPLLGDHLAMDLINTQARSHGELQDFWRTGDDVLRWLARCGITPAPDAGPVDLAALLEQAQALRALAQQLITRCKNGKDGKEGDIDGLNTYLQAYLSAPLLERGADGQLMLGRRARANALACLLGPVAEAVAQLLAEGDFDLVKQCEHPDCILWFVDRTKAHKRRWCSMALCGNRYKAAQFRKKNA